MRIIATFKYFCILCHWSLLGCFLVAMSWYILGPFWIPNILSDVDKTSLEMRDFGKNRFCRSGSNVCVQCHAANRETSPLEYWYTQIFSRQNLFWLECIFYTKTFLHKKIWTQYYLYFRIFVQRNICTTKNSSMDVKPTNAHCFHLGTGNMGWKLAFSKSFCVLYSMDSLLFQLWVVLYSPNSTTTPIPTLADAKLLLSYLGCQIHLLTLCFNIIFIVIKFIFIAMVLVIVSLIIVDVAMGKKIREMKSPKRLLRTMPRGRKLWQYCSWGLQPPHHPPPPQSSSWYPIKNRKNTNVMVSPRHSWEFKKF